MHWTIPPEHTRINTTVAQTQSIMKTRARLHTLLENLTDDAIA